MIGLQTMKWLNNAVFPTIVGAGCLSCTLDLGGDKFVTRCSALVGCHSKQITP